MAEVKGALDKALEDVDELVARELPSVVQAMVDVAKTSDDDRARVSAGTKLMEWARPPKQNPLVNINMPTVVSALGLPPGAGPRKKIPKAIEVRTVPKILPESNTLHETKFRGNFTAENPQQPATPAFAAPAPLTARYQTPQSPAQPPSASSVRISEMEREK